MKNSVEVEQSTGMQRELFRFCGKHRSVLIGTIVKIKGSYSRRRVHGTIKILIVGENESFNGIQIKIRARTFV